MKKIFTIGFALMFLYAALFADDAKVMPMMVGRLYVAPTYSFAMGEYSKDGDYKKFDDGSLKLFNLGFALEYGVIDWITAAVQWVPGWTPWSDLKSVPAVKEALGPPLNSTSNANVNGVADLFAGAKIQIAGEKAPARTNRVRLAFAPGAIIPLPGPDFEKEAEIPNLLAGKDAAFNSMDRHVFAAGGRFYLDFIVNKNFFINMYNETIFYPIKQDLNKDGPNLYLTKFGMTQNDDLKARLASMGLTPAQIGQIVPQIMDIKGEVDYQYRVTFEIEPVLTMSIASGIDFSAGLPVNYRYIPAYKYLFEYPEALATATAMLEPALLGKLNTDPQHSLSVNPNLSVFFMKTFLPLELKFQYAIPVWGQNTMARHNATLQVKAYFALPGRPQ